MMTSILYNLTAVLSLLVPALYFLKSPKEQNVIFWAILGVPVAGTLSWSFIQLSGQWHVSLVPAIWVTITATVISFSILCIISRLSWRITPLLMPYLAALGLWAVIWTTLPGLGSDQGIIESNWIIFHIILSVFTYALATIAAIFAFSAFLVERALKNKRPNKLTKMLPSVIDNEKLMVNLLIGCEVILALGILSGMGVQYMETQSLLEIDHKTLFSISAFIAILALLIAHHKSGIRGKKATRLVMVAYLLLSLGFLGVKFVSDMMAV